MEVERLPGAESTRKIVTYHDDSVAKLTGGSGATVQTVGRSGLTVREVEDHAMKPVGTHVSGTIVSICLWPAACQGMGEIVFIGGTSLYRQAVGGLGRGRLEALEMGNVVAHA